MKKPVMKAVKGKPVKPQAVVAKVKTALKEKKPMIIAIAKKGKK
jgi:Ni,Fe-hydrogenase III small subunit